VAKAAIAAKKTVLKRGVSEGVQVCEKAKVVPAGSAKEAHRGGPRLGVPSHRSLASPLASWGRPPACPAVPRPRVLDAAAAWPAATRPLWRKLPGAPGRGACPRLESRLLNLSEGSNKVDIKRDRVKKVECICTVNVCHQMN